MADWKVPFYTHQRQYENLKPELTAAMEEVFQSGKYVQGPALAKFEEELKEYMGTEYAIGVGNGTDALWLTFMALGLGKGDEMITNANTFFATAEAMWIAGATAVLVDCDPETRNIDPKAVKKAITHKTRAIVPVHLYGLTVDMKAIREIADEYGLYVIEDNAQAIDGHGDTFKQGELSDAVCTSFITQKNLGTYGDAGAIFTDHKFINDRVRKLRNHGSGARNVHSYGFNSRLDDIHAAILSVKLKKIGEFTDKRIEIGNKYNSELADAAKGWLRLPYVPAGYRHVFHCYVVETLDPSERDTFLNFLHENGVEAKTHYSIAIHRQDGFPWGKDARVDGPLPNAEANADSCITLPLVPELTDEEVQTTIDVVKKYAAQR
ncbi:MAG: DegT/DnrJ/EryC1/StrS family aminotransferase [Fibrobacterota bacterium]